MGKQGSKNNKRLSRELRRFENSSSYVKQVSKVTETQPLTKEELSNKISTQFRRLVTALNQISKPMNMRQLEIVTGIERASLCRRLATLQKDDRVIIAYYATCPISRYGSVGFYWLRSRGLSWVN